MMWDKVNNGDEKDNGRCIGGHIAVDGLHGVKGSAATTNLLLYKGSTGMTKCNWFFPIIVCSLNVYNFSILSYVHAYGLKSM